MWHNMTCSLLLLHRWSVVVMVTVVRMLPVLTSRYHVALHRGLVFFVAMHDE